MDVYSRLAALPNQEDRLLIDACNIEPEDIRVRLHFLSVIHLLRYIFSLRDTKTLLTVLFFGVSNSYYIHMALASVKEGLLGANWRLFLSLKAVTCTLNTHLCGLTFIGGSLKCYRSVTKILSPSFISMYFLN